MWGGLEIVKCLDPSYFTIFQQNMSIPLDVAKIRCSMLSDNSPASPGRFVVSAVYPAPQRIINKVSKVSNRIRKCMCERREEGVGENLKS